MIYSGQKIKLTNITIKSNKPMDIKIIKDILDDAKDCGCIAGISLSNGQLTHANFSKSKLFDFTADVLYNEKKHLVTILSENGNRDYIDSDTIMRIFVREGV